MVKIWKGQVLRLEITKASKGPALGPELLRSKVRRWPLGSSGPSRIWKKLVKLQTCYGLKTVAGTLSAH